jgi:tellurite resistance protein TehA-like permease
MKKAMGLIGLGVAGGTIPAGWAGLAHAGVVIGGAAGALALLVGVCLVAPVVARWRQRVSGRERRELFPAPRVVVRSTPAAHI